ncbi:MAG: PCRF domain-containing protein, partial [Candidatus Neomarinimicrobiota bacterium]
MPSRPSATTSDHWKGVFRNFGGIFDLAGLKSAISELQKGTAQPDFWDKPQQAQATLKQISDLEKELQMWTGLQTFHEEVEVHLELLKEEGLDIVPEDAVSSLSSYSSALDRAETIHLLNGPDDANDAILTIHP